MNLENHRKRIDDIDEKIVALLDERAEASREIGLIKAAAAIPVIDHDREKQVLRSIVRKTRNGMSYGAVVRIYLQILRESRAIQMSVASEVEIAGEKV
jgi:monofunctional chorismate mutase